MLIKEAVAGQCSDKINNYKADLCFGCGQVCLSQVEVEFGAKQVNWPVLEIMRLDIMSEVSNRYGTKVSVAEPRSEAIGLVVTICHVARALQQFDVKLGSHDGESLYAWRD